jgi:hypothetical protein
MWIGVIAIIAFLVYVFVKANEVTNASGEEQRKPQEEIEKAKGEKVNAILLIFAVLIGLMIMAFAGK